MGSKELTLEVKVSHVTQPVGGPGIGGHARVCQPLGLPCKVILPPWRGPPVTPGGSLLDLGTHFPPVPFLFNLSKASLGCFCLVL